jgi:hypothetical protein
MKFLAFNILVGAALAWLVLGGGGMPISLMSMLPSSTPVQTPVQQASAACPAEPTVGDASSLANQTPPNTAAPRLTRTEPVSEGPVRLPKREVLASLGREKSLVTTAVAAPPAAATAMTAEGRGAPSPSAAIRTEGSETSPTLEPTKPSLGRRDALMSLAESMELFSLERVAK